MAVLLFIYKDRWCRLEVAFQEMQRLLLSRARAGKRGIV